MAAAEVRGYVLAGGLSSRMGRDKAALAVGGRSMMAWTAEAVRQATGDVLALGVEREVGVPGLRWVADRRPGMGPLGGLEAALADAASAGVGQVLVVPVDVPLLPGGLLRALAERWVEHGCRVGYPEVEGRAQPAVAMVRVDALPAVQRALDAGNLRLREVLEEAAGDALCVERLELWEGRVVVGTDGTKLPWTPDQRAWELRSGWFANVNAPADVDWLERLLVQE